MSERDVTCGREKRTVMGVSKMSAVEEYLERIPMWAAKKNSLEDVRAYLEELGVFDEILETRAGGVISSHCGPGTLGVLYIAKS